MGISSQSAAHREFTVSSPRDAGVSIMITSKFPNASERASLSLFSLPTLVARSTSIPERSRSAGKIHKFLIPMCLGGPLDFSGLFFLQAAFIDLESRSGPSMQSSSFRDSSSTPRANNSFIVGPTLLLSTPKVVATFPFGSMSTSRTLLLRIP